MREIIDVILEDPKAFLIDGIVLLSIFAVWMVLYSVLACIIR